MRNDDAFPSHPGRFVAYDSSRTPERNITEEGVAQYLGPTWKITVTETYDTATVTLVLRDLLSDVDRTLKVAFEQDGVLLPATTSPSGILTEGTYTYVFTKDPKHPILIAPVVYLKNGTELRPAPLTIDFDSLANVLNLAAAMSGNTATITAKFDTDAAPGTGTAEWSLDEITWVLFDIAADFTGTFGVTLISTAQDIFVRAKNSAAVWGPSMKISVPKLSASLDVKMSITSTTATITWSGVAVVVSINGAGYSAPATSPISVARTTSDITYSFRSTVDGQTTSSTLVIPALAVTTTTTFGTFSGLTSVIQDATTNTLRFGWSYTGSPLAFQVMIAALEFTGSTTVFGPAGSVTTSYFDYVSTSNISPNPVGTATAIVVTFYVIPIIASTEGPNSIELSHTFQVDI